MGIRQGSVQSSFLFAAVIDVVSELKSGVLRELLYADYLVVMS